MRRSLALLVLGCCAASLLNAQGVPPKPDGRLLPIGAESLAIYLIRDTDTTRTGTVVDRLSSDGQRLTRIYDSNNAVTGPQLDTIVSSLADLRPIRYSSRSTQMIARLGFQGSRVSGWLRLSNGDSVGMDVALPEGVYDGTSYDLVVRASALREGFAMTVPVFMVGPNAVSPVSGRVTGSATIDGRACWVFTGNFGAMPVTFWIDKANRVLRQQLMQVSVNIAILFSTPRARPGMQRSS